MKPTTLKLVIFLLLGAVTTVAVAWGCAAWRQPPYDQGTWNARERFGYSLDGVSYLIEGATKPGIASYEGRWASEGVELDDVVWRRFRPPSWAFGVLECYAEAYGDPYDRGEGKISGLLNIQGAGWPLIGTDFLESAGTPPPPGELHRRVVHASGWPCLSMWWGEVVHSDYDEPWPSGIRVVDEETRYGIAIDPAQSSRDDGYWPRALPLAIITRGFAIDMLIFSVSWFVLVLTPFRIRRKVRRYERGLCPRCAFALRGDYTHPCPECGWKYQGAGTA